MDARWHIILLGGLRAEQGNGTHRLERFRTQKTAALFAYLAAYPNRSHSREELIERFWPDASAEEGRTSLRTALSSLRRQLEPPGTPANSVLATDRFQVRLNPDAVSTDTARFTDVLDAARRETGILPERETTLLREALTLYQGPFFPGSYDEWASALREHFAAEHQSVLRRLAALRAETGSLDESVEFARQAVAADPLDEEAQSDLIAFLAAAGRPAEALRQYRELERILRDEMGEKPSASLAVLAGRIQRGEPLPVPSAASHGSGAAKPLPAELPQEEPAPAIPGWIPLRLNRFFGRESEVALLTERLTDTSVRLVTLLGPGGIGKTRLSMEAADRLREDSTSSPFPGGIWFVPLAEVMDAARILEAVRETLRLPRGEAGDDALRQIAAALPETARVLLILDNFEQVAAGGASVVLSLLSRIPRLTCLVSSRQRLSLPGEIVFPVSPLPVPESAETVTPESLTRNPSVQLFTDRAQRSRPDFQVTPRSAATVAALCEKLEGIPLALELAAGWAQVLSPAQMLGRLDERFSLLATRRTDKVARHRSLWAALESSTELLAPEERMFLYRLAVFRGGWTPEAAAAVCEAPSALSLLAVLRDRSLILSEETESGAIRFRMLETIREFGEQQWNDAERERLCIRYAGYFARLAQAFAQKLSRADVPETLLGDVFLERDNLRTASQYALEQGDGGLPALMALCEFRSAYWGILGSHQEATEWFLKVTQTVPENSAAQAMALQQAAEALIWTGGGLTEAQALLEKSLAVSRSENNPEQIAKTLTTLGSVFARGWELNAAKEHYEEALALYRERNDERRVAGLLNNLGAISVYRLEHREALGLMQQGLEVSRRCGSTTDIACVLSNLGHTARHIGEDVMAVGYLDEALLLYRRIGHKGGIALVLEGLGQIADTQGDRERAMPLLKESLRLFREIGESPRIADSLFILGDVLAVQGKTDEASRCYAECRDLRIAMNDTSGIDAAESALQRLAERRTPATAAV